MTHCLCKPLIQGLVELRLFSLFFTCLFSSPVNRLKTESNPIQIVISTKLTAGKLWLPTFLKPKLYSSQADWIKAKRTTFPHSLNACFPLRTWMTSFPVPYSLSSFSFIDLRQLLLERTVELRLIRCSMSPQKTELLVGHELPFKL